MLKAKFYITSYSKNGTHNQYITCTVNDMLRECKRLSMRIFVRAFISKESYKYQFSENSGQAMLFRLGTYGFESTKWKALTAEQVKDWDEWQNKTHRHLKTTTTNINYIPF
jgi:hypothetical protein